MKSGNVSLWKRTWVAAVVVIAVAAGCSGVGDDDGNVKPVETGATEQTTTTEVPTTTTAVSEATKFGSWVNSTDSIGKSSLLASLFAEMADASGAGDLSATANACVQIGDAVADYQSIMPSGYDEYDRPMTLALTNMALGAATCVDAINSGDATLFEVAALFFKDATAGVNEATLATEELAQT